MTATDNVCAKGTVTFTLDDYLERRRFLPGQPDHRELDLLDRPGQTLDGGG